MSDVEVTGDHGSGRARGTVTVVLVGLLAAVAVALRLPYLHRPASIDEAGYLMVGGGWHAGGTSLYGDYWVDRPPLLIGLFQLASTLGGVVALRVVGCVAVVVVVGATAAAAHRIAGRRSAGWAALAAVGFLISPHLDAQLVDGELLAAPFVALGFLAVATAVTARARWTALVSALAAGVLLVAAVMVKQNMADTAVLGVVVLVLSLLQRRVTLRRGLEIVAAAAAGVLLAAGAVALWATLRGTSLSGLWYALYPFRLEARRLLGESVSARDLARKRALLDDVIISGLVLAGAAAVLGALRTRLDPFVTGLLVVLCYDVFSVAGGDGAWDHYLVEGIVPGSLVLGILVGRLWGVRLVALAVAASAAVAFVHHLGRTETREADIVGAALAHSARPGDTLVALYGRPGVNLAAGLPATYPYFWSLPIRVRDPGLHHLAGILDGTEGTAPTWVVVWGSTAFGKVPAPGVEAALQGHYRLDGSVRGHRVFLADGVSRPPLRP